MYVVQRGSRFTGYYRHKGKRLSAGTYDTFKEAQRQSLQRELGLATDPIEGELGAIGSKRTLSDYIDSWLPTSDLQAITRKEYGRILRSYVLPNLGAIEVSQISTAGVRKLLADLKAQGVGSATIAQAKASLGSALSPLVESGELPSNPTHGIKVKVQSGDISNVLTPEEFREVTSNLPSSSAKLLATFLVSSGCRFGEATELRAKDFNFKTGEVYVQRRVSEVGKAIGQGSRFIVVEATKSGYKRSVVLPKALLAEIKAYVQAKALGKDDLLFPKALVLEPSKIASPREAIPPQPFESGVNYRHGTLTGYSKGKCRCDDCREALRSYRAEKRKPYQKAKQKQKPYQKQDLKDKAIPKESGHLSRGEWRTIWNQAIAKSGIGWNPRTHDLRHANATALLKNGVDVHEVKERLGHQSIKTTERYLHRLRHQRSKAAEAVSDFME